MSSLQENNNSDVFHIYLDVDDNDDGVKLKDQRSTIHYDVVTTYKNTSMVGSSEHQIPHHNNGSFASQQKIKLISFNRLPPNTNEEQHPVVEIAATKNDTAIEPTKERNCSKCSATFRCSGQLEQHTLSVHHVGLIKYWIQCPYCRRGFHDKATLKSHISVLHKATDKIPQSSFPCQYCSWLFESELNLQRHMDVPIRKKDEKQFVCDVCDIIFSSINDYAKHMNVTHSLLSAPPIQKLAQPKAIEKTHILTTIEHKVVTHAKLLNENQSRVQQTEEIPLETQPKAMETSTHRSKDDEKTKHVCRVCDKQFTRSVLLRRHIREHIGDAVLSRVDRQKPAVQKQAWKCKTCELAFNCKGQLTNHRIKKHQKYRWNGGEYHVKCPHCSRIYDSAPQLGLHIDRLHRDDKPLQSYQCEHCDWRYERVHTLAEHLGRDKAPLQRKTGTNEHHQQYKCDICKSRFSSIAEIYEHMRSRHGAGIRPPYHCDECQRPYEYLSLLSKHIRTHTGERPFLCKLCSRRYQSGRNLLRHMRRNHKQTVEKS